MSDYLSHDLLSLILKLLPVKTLLRCRSVSKSWKQLISSQSFISDHLSLQTPRIISRNQVFNYLHSDPQHLPLLHRATFTFQGLTVYKLSAVGSLHGVICLFDFGRTNLLLLWNPSIRRILPVLQPAFACAGVDFKNCGFWIDPSSNHFKIVIFSLVEKNAAVFSSLKPGWTEVDMGGVDGIRQYEESAQVLVDGVAHWIAFNDLECHYIISFDFGHDKLGTIELPRVLIDGDCVGLSVCKWKGLLSATHYDHLRSDVCDLWALQNGSWSRMFTCKLPERLSSVLCVLGSCGRVLAETSRGPRLVLYDPEDGRTNLFMADYMNNMRARFASDFVESLVFPDQRQE